jgi:phosphomannomutase
MTNSIFKAYDIRGVYPKEINESVVFEITKALGKYFGKDAKLIIGYDARLSSPALYRAVIDGIMNNESGIKDKGENSIIHNSKFIIRAVGMITTPMLYFLVNQLKADGGIMVTASHNPKEYNGLKVVGKNAVPMSGKEIEKLVNFS